MYKQSKTGLLFNIFPHTFNKWQICIFISIFILYIFNSIGYLNSQSITFDEPGFLNYAVRYLKGEPERISPMRDDSKMPVIALNLIPRISQQFFRKDLKKNDEGYSDIMMGRYVTLFFSLFTLLIVFSWTFKLYGSLSAFTALFMLSFCPNNLSASSLVTTDSYSVLILILILFLLWQWIQKPTLKAFIFLSISIAFAQVIKQSLFHLYILIPSLLLIYLITYRPKITRKSFFTYFLVFVILQILIINAVYFFSGSFHSLSSYEFISTPFIDIQKFLPQNLPIPLPKPFIQGLDFASSVNEIGGGVDGVSGYGKITILGKEATQGSFWYYYLVTLFFKTPIPCLFLFFFSVIKVVRSAFVSKEFFKNEMILLGTFLYFLVYFSFFYKTQIGVRHIIFLYPIMFILSSAAILSMKSKTQKLLVAVFLVYQMVSVLMYLHNYHPYTNEFIINKAKAYTIVGSANLELGQGKYFADEYLKKHSEASYVKEIPQNGIYIITTSDYMDIWNLKKYSWLQKYKPFDHVAYNWLLIKVDDLK